MLKNTSLRWLTVACFVATALWMAQASWAAEKPVFGGVLRVATSASPPTLDPYPTTHIAVREIGMHIFENLLTFDAKFQLVPQLAEKWEVSPDGKTYSFTLRKGVKFHNGKEMTAEDVKASVERFKDVAARRSELDDLEKVEVVNPYVVRMSLSKVNAAFLAALANPLGQLAILPKEAVEGRPVNKVDIIGTGPFMFVEWIPDRWVKIGRFKDYKPWGKPNLGGYAGARTAYLDEIRFIPVPEPGARVAGLQTGEYDFADFLPSPAIASLSKDKKVKIVALAPYNYPTLYFNHSGKFKELKLRQAVQAALNMGEILQVASDGNGRVDPGFYFKEQIWHSAAGKELYNQNNPGKAKELLKDAGYNGEPFVMVTNTDYDYMYKAGLVVLQQLKKAGMNIKLEVYDWPGALAVRKDLTKWDLFFSGHSTFYDPSGMNFYFLPKSTFFAYSNPKMEAIIERANSSLKFDDRYKAYEEMQRLIYDDTAMIKLYDQNVWEGYSTKVKGYTPWVMIRFWDVWMEK
jgi:peptide/nickel transport system substrate-binding protein